MREIVSIITREGWGGLSSPKNQGIAGDGGTTVVEQVPGGISRDGLVGGVRGDGGTKI